MSADPTRVALAGTDELRDDLRRSRLMRLGLAGALVAALAAGTFAARGAPAAPTLVATGSDGVIVLDVSASVGPPQYRQLVRALDEASESGRRYGLVVFSDVAYEVFPPGTDPAQIRALRRFYLPVRGRSARRRLGVLRSNGRTYRASVWVEGLTGGTRISRGLELARRIIRRDAIANPSVVLVSDLDYDRRDLAPLERTIATYARERLPVRVVALSPDRESGRLLDRFRELPSVANADVSYVGAAQATPETGPPYDLAVLAALLLALLAANELACGRLTWFAGRSPEEPA